MSAWGDSWAAAWDDSWGTLGVEPYRISFSMEGQRRTIFNIDAPSVIMGMIEEPVITSFILLESGDFLLLETGDKVIRSG